MVANWCEFQSGGEMGKGKFNSAIRKGLEFLDKLEGKRTKYLTGRYIAVKAVKRNGG
jgi:hypothetical protein